MELKEFVGLKPSEIRRDKGLMQLYVDFYEAAFFLKPNCIGCSFKSGFKKLKKYANNGEKTVNLVENTKPMETKTFILKNQYKLKILSYKKDGVTHRKYGHSITEDFARELVKAGRTEIFAKLPGSTGNLDASIGKKEGIFKGNEKKESKNDPNELDYKNAAITEYNPKSFADMDYRTELLPLYNEIKDRTGKSAIGKSKQDIIDFLEKHEG